MKLRIHTLLRGRGRIPPLAESDVSINRKVTTSEKGDYRCSLKIDFPWRYRIIQISGLNVLTPLAQKWQTAKISEKYDKGKL